MSKTKRLCFLSMFIALTVILSYLSGFLRIGNISKISISFISVYLSAAAFGPLAGGLVGGISDLISYLVNPTGVYLWPLSLIEFFYGFIAGILFFKDKSFKTFKIIIMAVIRFFADLFLKTPVLMFAGYLPESFHGACVIRLPSVFVMLLIQIAFLILINPYLKKIIKSISADSKILNYAKSYHTNINLKLDNINELLHLLNNPHKNLKYIHIAGTNGKGSVSAFLEEMLVCEGYKTGRFSSPELIKRNETIRINKKDIPDSILESLLKEVDTKASKMKNYPSPFEILLAAAFLYFKRENCNYVVLETGMGGEGDATNIIDSCEIAVITKISLDHTAYLGETIEEIARIKSGIIKEISKIVTCRANEKLFHILRKNNEFYIADKLETNGFSEIFEKVSYRNKSFNLSLGGLNQLENASLAIKAAELLNISEESIIYGLSNAKNPARLEKLGENIFFDGAHNPDGAQALKNSIDRYFPDKKRAYVMGVMKDKDFSLMLDILNDKNSFFYFIDVTDNERAMPKEKMLEIAKSKGLDAEICKNLKEAVKKADADVIIICGSLYMYRHSVVEHLMV